MKELLKDGKQDVPLSLSEVITGSIITGPSNIAQMPDGAVFEFKAELRKATKRNLREMTLSQRQKDCLLGEVCPFLLEYRRILFCVSEILGLGNQTNMLFPIEIQPETGSQNLISRQLRLPLYVPVKKLRYDTSKPTMEKKPSAHN